ncbi:putative microtubule-associated protein [Schistosoma mansoni]|uniref:putative microtubule-associated protein n=1 Tax=Schistosoma mansoni TaxID=6183 RepID=UPI0001A62FFA|nr:putative microtubule-associated protein [Schistosoma mansoni]|eukprot:XP_018650416.1 putative microtubule-associated protein [Schistosoma mansoni]
MAVTRIAIVLGELLDEGQKSSLVKDVIQGLSTSPPDFLLKIQSHLDKLTSNQQCSPECIFSYKEEDFEFLTLCRPSSSGITSLLTNFLQPPKNSDVTLNVILIYAGLLSDGSAHWLLPNFVLTPTFLTDFIQHLSTLHPKPDDTESLPSHKPIRLHIGIGAVSSGGDWRHLVSNPPQPIGGHVFQVTVNRCRTVSKPKSNKPTDIPSPSSSSFGSSNHYQLSIITTAVNAFFKDFESFLCDMLTKLPDPYSPPLSQTLVMRSPTDLTLKVSKPCIYVFPEGSGQVSILALPFYNMLIDGGCSHKPCFWSVANYLDRLDSVLITHWGIDNILGLNTILPTVFKPSNDQSLLCLLTPPPNINNMKINNPTQDPLPFTVNLPMHFSNLVGEIKRSGTNLMVYPVTRGGKLSVVPKPLQLFQKVGQGCLELFPLTPGDDDSAELRKLNDDWSKCAPSLMTTSVLLNKSSGNKTTVPLLSYTSVSALVIWRPTSDTEPILRFLFVSPNAHQTRILSSLDALITGFIYLRHPKAIPAEFERKRPPQPLSAASRRPTIPATHATSGSNEGSVNSVGQNHHNTTASRPSHVAKKATTTKTTQDNTAHRPPSSKTPASSKTQADAKPPVHKTNQVVKNADVVVESPSKQLEVHDNEVSTPNSLPSKLITESSNIHNISNNIINGDIMHKTNGFTHDLSDFEPSVSSEQTNHDLLTHDMNLMKLQDYSENDSNQMMSPGLDEYDPIASWGSPQNLPLPPTGNSKSRLSLAPRVGGIHSNTSNQPVTYPAGYTIASGHAPGTTKAPPYDKVKPIYVDVAFLPGSGNSNYVDAEWFKRVRARYYVATDVRPTCSLLESLVVGKESWSGDDAQLDVSLILAYETEELLIWLGVNAGRLNNCHVNVAAVISRSSIQILNEKASAGGDGPLNYPGYRIDLC